MRARSKKIKDFKRWDIHTKIYSATYRDPIARETVALEEGSGRVGGIRFYIDRGLVLEDSRGRGFLDRF